MQKLMTALLAAIVLVVTAPAAAQDYAFEDIVYLSCTEAWEQAGEEVDAVVEMIRVMAAFSMEKRGLAVTEDDPELDDQFGQLIHGGCTLDPDALLFGVVDRSIRRLAE